MRACKLYDHTPLHARSSPPPGGPATRATVKHPTLVGAHSLTSRIAGTITGRGPWLQWETPPAGDNTYPGIGGMLKLLGSSLDRSHPFWQLLPELLDVSDGSAATRIERMGVWLVSLAVAVQRTLRDEEHLQVLVQERNLTPLEIALLQYVRRMYQLYVESGEGSTDLLRLSRLSRTSCGHAAQSTRRRSRSKPALPYIWRLSVLSRLICPSACPLLHGSSSAALIAV